MRYVLVIAIASGCGRIGFAPTAGVGDGSAGSDAPIAGFDTRPGIDANVVFVLHTSLVLGTLGGFGPADAACQAAANQAGLAGSYVAWLSTSTTNAIDRLAGARGWVRPDGAPFADTAADIAAGKMFYPPMLDENGVLSGALPMTGTLGNGTVDSGLTCGDYTLTTGSIRGGESGATSGTFTDAKSYAACNQAATDVYCFGTSLATPVAPMPVTGRRAFVSTPWGPGSGLSGADAHCQSDAVAAGLSGQYAAVLASPTTAAAARFDTTGATWVRLDGVALAATAPEVMASAIAAPLNVTSTGAYVGFGTTNIWTGALTPTDTNNTKTCNDWTVGTAAQQSLIAAPEVVGWFVNPYTGSSCNGTASLYCFEL